MAQTRDIEATIVQVSRGLPSSDADWTWAPFLELMSATDGAGQIAGGADFELITGRRTYVNQHVFEQVDLTQTGALIGLLVRVLKRSDDSGTIEFNGHNWEAVWHGQIQNENYLGQVGETAEPLARRQFAAVGMSALLQQVVIDRGYALASDGTVGSPGRCLRFNAISGGDRSVSTVALGGLSVYCHDLRSPTGEYWTAKNVLDFVLAAFARPLSSYDGSPSGFVWAISDPDNCLSYVVETLDLDGLTVFEALTLLAGPRRGLTWRTAVNADGTITVHIRSTSSAAIAVGSYTLPASSYASAIDLRGDLYYEAPEITTDLSSEFDSIEIRGGLPWVGLSLSLSQFDHGWSAAAETIWTTNPLSSLTAHVWRRFVLPTTWNGRSHDGLVGLRNLRAVESSAAHGEYGRDGTRSFSDPPSIAASTNVQAERLLPCSLGFSSLQEGDREKPVLLVNPTTDDVTAGGWLDAVAQLNWSVEVNEYPPSITIDDGNRGALVKEYLASGGIIISLGFREREPLSVSWRRPQANWPCQHPRTKTIQAPHLQQWQIFDGTFTGADLTTGLLNTASELTIKNDVPAMLRLLALYRAYYGSATVRLTLTNRAIMDTNASTAPGAIITTLTDGEGEHDIDAVITSRVYRRAEINGVPMYHTVITTDQIVPELEAFI